MEVYDLEHILYVSLCNAIKISVIRWKCSRYTHNKRRFNLEKYHSDHLLMGANRKILYSTEEKEQHPAECNCSAYYMRHWKSLLLMDWKGVNYDCHTHTERQTKKPLMDCGNFSPLQVNLHLPDTDGLSSGFLLLASAETKDAMTHADEKEQLLTC